MVRQVVKSASSLLTRNWRNILESPATAVPGTACYSICTVSALREDQWCEDLIRERICRGTVHGDSEERSGLHHLRRKQAF